MGESAAERDQEPTDEQEHEYRDEQRPEQGVHKGAVLLEDERAHVDAVDGHGPEQDGRDVVTGDAEGEHGHERPATDRVVAGFGGGEAFHRPRRGRARARQRTDAHSDAA